MDPLTSRFGAMDNLEGQTGLEAAHPLCLSPESPLHRFNRVNIDHAVSHSSEAIPCALRENLVEDCSHAKLVNWIWHSRANASHLDDSQRNECPMPLCRKVFSDFPGMIAHLHGCPEVATGLYWCWDCYRAEVFPVSHCRSCKYTWAQSSSIFGNTMKKVKRALSDPFRRSLKGKRTRKDTNVSPVTSTTATSPTTPTPPTTAISELFGNSVHELQSPIPPYDQYFQPQHSSQLQPLASPSPWANFASIEPADPVARQAPRTAYPAELPAHSAPCLDFFIAPSSGRPVPSSSPSNASSLSFRTRSQQPRGSLVSLASPRLSVVGSENFSPLSVPATTAGAAGRSSPLADSVLCESPTTLEDASDLNQDFSCWPQPKPSSWSSIDTYIGHAGDVTDLRPAVCELEGSLPDTTMRRFGNNITKVGSTSLRRKSIPQTINTQAAVGYEWPAKEFTPQHTRTIASNEEFVTVPHDGDNVSRVIQNSLAALVPTLYDNSFQSIGSMGGVNSPLLSDAFFRESVYAVHNVHNQLDHISRDKTGDDRRPLEMTRQYNTEMPQQKTGSTAARQYSWSSTSSTTIDCNERRDHLFPIVNPVIAGSPVTTMSRTDARHPPGTTIKRRIRATKFETKEESCPYCDYTNGSIDRRKLVKRHMKTHEDTQEWFECGFSLPDGSVCIKGYNRRDNLRDHQRKKLHTHGGGEKKVLRKRLPGGPKYRPDIY